LQVEAAREDGGHDLLSLPFRLDPRHALDVRRDGQGEIGALHLHGAAAR
jgi:hypothetical protein